jgi:predicted transcriptional regulator
MRSRLAEQLRTEQRERFARMTPAERVALTERLGEEGLREYMTANHLDRAAAVSAIKRSRRAGRRPSRCLDED